MPYRRQSAMRSRSPLGLVFIAVATALIFFADTLTDYAIAAAVFYTAIVLVAARLFAARVVVVLAATCVVLALISGFVLTGHGTFAVGLINTTISISAIAITTYLSLRLVAAEAETYEARERLMRIARVTSLGELVTSIAHEVNQPLAALTTSAGAARRWLTQDPPALDKTLSAIERIIIDANRVDAVISRVRGFASGKPPQREPFTIDALVHDIVALAQGQLDRYDITLSLSADGMPPVIADRVQIGQVLSNLLLNAIESVSAGAGTRREITIAATRDGAGQLDISVADSGPGFRPGDTERLFDAFWTTKADGLGLGLTLSRSIVEANGGRIWAAHNAGGGAVLAFTLPLMPPTESTQ